MAKKTTKSRSKKPPVEAVDRANAVVDAATREADGSPAATAFDARSAPIVSKDEIRTIAGPPMLGTPGRPYTRADLVRAIRQGGSVLHNGVMITNEGQLPSDKELEQYTKDRAQAQNRLVTP